MDGLVESYGLQKLVHG